MNIEEKKARFMELIQNGNLTDAEIEECYQKAMDWKYASDIAKSRYFFKLSSLIVDKSFIWLIEYHYLDRNIYL